MKNLTIDQIVLMQLLTEKISNSSATPDEKLEMLQIITKIAKHE